MGVDFAIDVEPREPSTTDISEAEIDRGVTPLSQFLREGDGELVVEGDYVYDNADEEQSSIASSNAERRRRILDRGPARDQWCDPADGLRTVHALQADLPTRQADYRRALDCLVIVEKILSIAHRERRRWRLLAFW